MKTKDQTIVVALGGNAMSPQGGTGTVAELQQRINVACKQIAPLARKYRLVIVSGSGPQIGNLLLQNEAAKKKVPPSPLDVLDAEIEGELGYLLQQTLENETHLKGKVITIVTQVLVDTKDPAFNRPTKPIGPFYTEEQAKKLRKEKKWIIINDAGHGFRRVVASPQPKEIIEANIIKDLLNEKTIVIAAGGGGIPVIKKNGRLQGVEAVIDKDRASNRLAQEIHADLLLILTGVKKVCLNYGKPNQQELSRITVAEARRYLKEGQFPEGSMGPKIEAAIDFVAKTGKEALITCPSCIESALEGKEGTLITR